MPLAKGIDDDLDLDAPLGGSRKGPYELLPRGIPVEDVGGEVHRAPGSFDRSKHRRVGLLAVPERLDEIASDERLAGYPARQVDQVG